MSSSGESKRVIVAVSGTIQDGFELRSNIDFQEGNEVVAALFLGYGVFRGVKMYFDVKDENCREYDATLPHRLNPALVLTGNAKDVNQYALYLVDERACIQALLGEPRYLTMAPDAVRLALDDPDTSPAVRAVARAMIEADGKTNFKEACVLAVVPCWHSKKSFYPAPFVERDDGSRLTSFQSSLAAFAGMEGDMMHPSSKEWNAAVAKALGTIRSNDGTTSSGVYGDNICATRITETMMEDGDCDDLYGADTTISRLSRRVTKTEFNDMASIAGIDLRAE